MKIVKKSDRKVLFGTSYQAWVTKYITSQSCVFGIDAIESSIFNISSKYNLTRKNIILVMIGSLGLLLHIVGIMSLHWIECAESWLINDEVTCPRHCC